MTIKTHEDFDTMQEYFDYLAQIQADKNAQAEAEMLAREENQ
jgi:spore coat polysaccharide biosynthesis protein SpsF (cytidylyltransferase family)